MSSSHTRYPQPQPAGEPACLSLRQRLVLWLAVAVVKTTPTGTPVLDHLRRVRQERGLLKSSATSLNSTQLELSFPNSDYTLTSGTQDISFLDLPSEPIAFSPHLPFSSSSKSTACPGDHENHLSESLIGPGNEVLRDRLLDLQTELDSLRSQLATPCTAAEIQQNNTKRMRKGADASDKALSTTPSERARHADCHSISTQTTAFDDGELIRRQANVLKSLDPLCRNTQPIEALITTQDVLQPGASMHDATTFPIIMEIVHEATRMILSPLTDLPSVQKAYQLTMKRLLDHMAAQLLTLQQLHQVSGAFEMAWMRLLQSTSVYEQDRDVTSAMEEYLLVRPLSSPSQRLQMKHQTHLLFSQLLATLKVIFQQLENRRSVVPCEMDVDTSRGLHSSRLSCKAKTQARQQRVRRALEARHQQWRADQDLAWLVALAMPLDRDCVRNMRIIQSQSMQGKNSSPDLDEVTRRGEGRAMGMQPRGMGGNSLGLRPY
ncbi:unnamed protein product [Mortierella alpina]